MPARIWITRVKLEDGKPLPDIVQDVSWVGNLIQLPGGGYRYVIKVPWTHPVWVQTGTDPHGEATGEMQNVAHPDAADLSGELNVVGPVTRQQALTWFQNQNAETRGWARRTIRSWKLGGTA